MYTYTILSLTLLPLHSPPSYHPSSLSSASSPLSSLSFLSSLLFSHSSSSLPLISCLFHLVRLWVNLEVNYPILPTPSFSLPPCPLLLTPPSHSLSLTPSFTLPHSHPVLLTPSFWPPPSHIVLLTFSLFHVPSFMCTHPSGDECGRESGGESGIASGREERR